jgi:hypothetical protein
VAADELLESLGNRKALELRCGGNIIWGHATRKAIELGIRCDGAIVYGYAVRLTVPEHRLDTTYLLLHNDSEEELIQIDDIWDDSVIIKGEMILSGTEPIFQKLKEFVNQLEKPAHVRIEEDAMLKTSAKHVRSSRFYVTLKIILNILKTAFMRPRKVTLISRETGDIIE